MMLMTMTMVAMMVMTMMATLRDNVRTQCSQASRWVRRLKQTGTCRGSSSAEIILHFQPLFANKRRQHFRQTRP